MQCALTGGSNYLGEQGFRQKRCFRVIRGSCGNWTAAATDEVFPIFLPKRGHPAELLENANTGIDSLPPGFAFYLSKMFLRYGYVRRHAFRRARFLA